MSSLPFLLLLVFCICFHACMACPFGNTRKDTAKNPFHKEVDKVTLLEICESCSSTSTLNEMIVEGTSGIELSTSLQRDSSSFLPIKKQRKHSRSMLGPSMHHLQQNPSDDSAEDIVDMDYAQPHRKPPIHNDKP